MEENRRLVHDCPWLRLTDPVIKTGFFLRSGIDPSADRKTLIAVVSRAFSLLPYENLTKIIKADALVTASSAMRYPDEVISDWLKWGTGGTCFSLTAALIAVFDALGIESHPVLADRHYGSDTHCGLVIIESGALLLLDPGYLLFTPTAAPVDTPASIDMQHNRIELVPHAGGRRVELFTVVKGSRKLRLTYKMEPVDALAFYRAWERSFAWEMMTYPVLTRCAAGVHHYVQGSKVCSRSNEKTHRLELAPQEKARFITSAFGIDPSIVTKALEIVSHGAAAASHPG